MNNQRSSNNSRRQRNRTRNQHLDHNQQQRNQHHPQQRQPHHQNQRPDHTGQPSTSQPEQQQDFQPHHATESTFIPHQETGTHAQMYQETYDATQYVPVTTHQHQSNYAQMQAYQQHESQQYLAQQQIYMSNPLDEAAENISRANQCAARRAIDSVYAMPISDHVYYNSFESYNKLMMEQQGSIVNMMSSLSTCYYQPMDHTNYSSSLTGVEFGDIPASIDKYEMLHRMNNEMFDEIGHNLDYADGSYQTEAQSVQATLLAANQNRSIALSQLLAHQPSTNRAQTLAGGYQHPSSSFPLITRPSEIGFPASFQQALDQHEPPNQQQRYNQFNPNQRRYPRYSKNANFFRSVENKNIPRPQDQFSDKIDNSLRPFKPIIKEKPNASVPLSLTAKVDKRNNSYYDHPYANEIQQFQVDPDLLVYREPIEPAELNATPILMVETIEELQIMCSDIEAQQEFAVDVEHHSYRSYQGLTCLLQISTRTQDYVIDAIKLRSYLHRLNKSFTNPNIVKVFHGADCDILWLQRDFGVYVVNLFDTSRAAKLMKFPHLSLAYLLRHYCNIDPDKSYQLADWRERPIPPAMLQYARSDTHFLLYIYDRLKNDLLSEDNEPGVGVEMIRSVFQKGKEICLKRYEKPPFSENSHLSVLRKSRIPFNAKQMYALKEMYAWRDRIGRELDESVGYVLPNSMMMRIAEALPREPQGITALVKPVPQVLNKYLSDVHAIILKALDVPLDEKSKLMAENPMSANPSLRSIELDSVTLKQDTAHASGVQENSLPNLLDDKNQYNNHMNGRTNGYGYNRGNTYGDTHSTLYKFVDPAYNRVNDLNKMMTGVHTALEHFVPPYERYKESTR